MNIEGILRRLTPLGTSGPQGPRIVPSSGNMGVDIGLPLEAEMCIAGARYGFVVGNGATFKAPIVAMPTTTATWGLFNGNPLGGPSLFIRQASFFLASGTAGLGASLIGTVALTELTTIPTAFGSTVASNLSGKANNSLCVLANNLTIPGTQPAWVVLAGGDSGADTAIGFGFTAVLNGGLMVPPQRCLYLDVLASAGTSALYGVSVIADLLQTDRV